MRKILVGLSAGVAMLFGTSAFAAGIGIGVSGNLLKFDATGTETMGTLGSEVDASVTTATITNSETIGSYYLEFTMGDDNGFAFGWEKVPGSADVSDKATHTRSDTELSVTGDVTQNSGSRTFTADAEVEDFSVIYTEIPLGSAFYLRAGVSEITVNTLETASSNGGNYGNATLDGTQYGFGVKGLIRDRLRWKVGYEVNNFETLNLTSSGNSVSTETNKITADLDTKTVKFGVGIQF